MTQPPMTQRERMTYVESLRVMWALIWRSLVISGLAVLSGFVIGFVAGFGLGAGGASLRTIQVVAGALGASIGFFVWAPLLIRWTLPRDFGSFRLDLVRSAISAVPPH